MKVILVQVQFQNEEKSLVELEALCKACHIDVDQEFIQKREKIDVATYIGKGKVQEIKRSITYQDMVIFDDELSPLQIRNLTDILGIEVTDRTDLILTIFDQRAKTKEAKLQIEIARYLYLLPRLIGMQEHLSHQQGGSGFRGRGEKQIELDRRFISRKLTKAKKELADIVKQRQTQRQRRKQNEMPVIALVGYTNSGKSTLMNAFCLEDKQKVLQQDMLFATLQTATRHISIHHHPCLLTDTVGFIDRLPHHLVQAFRSTLEEVKEADLLLHVIDISQPNYMQHINTTNEVLRSLGVVDTPVIYVYNKIDLNRVWFPPQEPCVYISAKDKKGLDELENEISHILFKDYEVYELNIPYENGEVFNYLHHHCLVVEFKYLQESIYIKVEAKRKEIQPYRQYILKH